MKYIEKTIHKIAKWMVYGAKSDSKKYIKYLRRLGMEIGDGTVFYNPMTVSIAEGCPYLIQIGRNCKITGGVVILEHDYGWAVTKSIYGDVLGSVRPVKIGNSVYIGMNAIILAGVTVGDNVIIGANSVVSKDIPSNCVAIGSPCKPVFSIEEYHEKRKESQLKEAVAIIHRYYERYGTLPKREELSEHFWLFENSEDIPECFKKQNNRILGSEEKTWDNFLTHQPMFKNYEELLHYAMNLYKSE